MLVFEQHQKVPVLFSGWELAPGLEHPWPIKVPDRRVPAGYPDSLPLVRLPGSQCSPLSPLQEERETEKHGIIEVLGKTFRRSYWLDVLTFF